MNFLKQRREEPKLILYQQYLHDNPEEDHDSEPEEVFGSGRIRLSPRTGKVVVAAAIVLFLLAIPAVVLNQSISSKVEEKIETVKREVQTIKESALNADSGTDSNVIYDKEALKGKDGENGKDGEHGLNGKDGKDGADGINGKDGLNGKDGVNGSSGSDGRSGADGSSGKDGSNGKDGLKGEDGVDGAEGEKGADGINGTDGVNGLDGKDGLNGKDGLDGKSTYQLALEAGYGGTEAELAAILSTAETKITALDQNLVKTKEELMKGLQDCFQSASEGKIKLAAALTGQGVPTNDDATFEIMAENINKIKKNPVIVYNRHHHEGSAGGGGCYSAPVYHSHSGNNVVGGGCYCSGKVKYYGDYIKIDSSRWRYDRTCKTCGFFEQYESTSPPIDMNGYERYCASVICGKSTSTVESWTMGCGYQENEIVDAELVYE